MFLYILKEKSTPAYALACLFRTIEECSDNEEEIDPTNVLSGRKHGLKLIKDVCTHWNSTFYMLQRCVLLKEAINHVLQESKYANLIPTSEQWLAAEKLCNHFRLPQTSCKERSTLLLDVFLAT